MWRGAFSIRVRIQTQTILHTHAHASADIRGPIRKASWVPVLSLPEWLRSYGCVGSRPEELQSTSGHKRSRVHGGGAMHSVSVQINRRCVTGESTGARFVYNQQEAVLKATAVRSPE